MMPTAVSRLPPVAADPRPPPAVVTQSAVTYSGFTGYNCQSCGVALYQDTDVAIGTFSGTKYLVETVGGGFSIYANSGGSFTLQGSPHYFSDILGYPNTCGDSRILFDPQSQRWFGEALITSLPNCAGVVSVGIAVSYNADPNTPWEWPFYYKWKGYNITQTAGPAGSDSGPYFPDHPEITVTTDKLIITADMAFTSGLGYWVINKNDLITGSSPYRWQQPGVSGFPCTTGREPDGRLGQITPARAVSSTSAAYLICPVFNSNTINYDFQLFSVDGLPPGITTPSSRTIIAHAGAPPSISVLGTPPTFGGPANGNWLLTQNAYWSSATGYLWFATPIGCNAGDRIHSCIHLTQVALGSSPSVKQDFNYSINGFDFYLPTLGIDGQGDLSLLFGYSTPNVYPSFAVAGQIQGDSPNTLTTWVVEQVGQGTTARFLDYFGAAADPSDATSVWAVGSYYSTSSGPSTFLSSIQLKGLTLWASPGYFNVGSGQTASIVVQVTARASLSGTVYLSASVSPSGPTATVNPTSLQLTMGGGSQTTATVNATGVPVGGTYNLWINGQASGGLWSLSPSLILTVTVVSPLICSASASPTSGKGSVTVNFSASCSSGLPPFSYYWSFNDGTGAGSSSQYTQYTYYYPNPSGGSDYHPTLTIYDMNGLAVYPSLPTIYAYNPCPRCI